MKKITGNEFDAISRQIWLDMRKGTPDELGGPACGNFSYATYGTKIGDLIYLRPLVDFIKKYGVDRSAIFNWKDFALTFKDEMLDTERDVVFETREWLKGVVYNTISDFKDSEGKAMPFCTKLNKRVCYLDGGTTAAWGISINIAPKRKLLTAELFFFYEDSKDYRPVKVVNNNYEEASVDEKYIAISIATEQFAHLITLINLLFGSNTASSVQKTMGVKYAQVIESTQDASELDYLYNHIPPFLVDTIKAYAPLDKDLLFRHLMLMKKKDEDSVFKDMSGSIITILKLVNDTKWLYEKFTTNYNLLKEFFYNLDGSSEYEGKMTHNKIIFASFLWTLCRVNGWRGYVTENKRPVPDSRNTFYFNNNKKVKSNIHWEDDKNPEKYFLQQLVPVTYIKEVWGPSEKLLPETAEKASLEEANEGADFFPFEPVFYVNDDATEKQPSLVPAIYIKALAHTGQVEDIQRGLRIGLNILGIMSGLGALSAGSLIWRILAIADLALTTADLGVALAEEELKKTEEGRAFLEMWDKIALAGGLITAGPVLIRDLLNKGIKAYGKLIAVAREIPQSLAQARKFVGLLLVKVLMEIDIVKAKYAALEILIAAEVAKFTKTVIRSLEVTRLEALGVVFLKGVVWGGKREELIVVYKGEIIASGTAREVREALKDVWKAANKNLEAVLNAILTYKQVYPVRKLSSLLTPSEGFELFGNHGKKLIEEVDKQVEIALRNATSQSQLNKKVMISGMTYLGDAKRKVFWGTNFIDDDFKLGNFKKFLLEMHPTLKWRFEKHLKILKEKNIKASIEDILRAGKEGSHGEIRALDALLKHIDPKGVLGEAVFDNIISYNRFLRKSADKLQPPCVHCYYLTSGIRYLGF